MGGLDLGGFLRAFPPDPETHAAVDAESLSAEAKREFGVEVPPELKALWSTAGAGYFGRRALYIFGQHREPSYRASFVSWNLEPFWREIYPPATMEGPLFFAETCFGEQLGVRFGREGCVPMIFLPDTFEAFVGARTLREFFENVLVRRDAITDPDRLARVGAALGPLPVGKHYAPIVSPLAGGGDETENFHLETPNVHLRTAAATYRAIAGDRHT